MASFDVTSLFTNIPVQQALSCVQQRLLSNFHLWDHKTILTTTQLLQLIEICATSTYFRYNNQWFQQIKGLAMGSSLSPIIACIFMEEFEFQTLAQAPQRPLSWWRYIDDVFILYDNSKLDINDLLQHFNSSDPTESIKFTLELESNGSLPFLDCLITKQPHFNDNSFDFHIDIYRKPTHSNRIIHWNSNQPYHQKLGILHNFIQ